MAYEHMYIGARLVPKFDEEIDFNSSKQYEPLIIVRYDSALYISRCFVPSNSNISDTTYWINFTPIIVQNEPEVL